MYNNFLCPKCKNSLNIDRHVVFVVEKYDGVRGLLLLSSDLGDYTIRSNPSFEVEEGERLEFYCPMCHGRLTGYSHPNLVSVLLLDKEGEDSQVFFSRIVGQNSTYLLKDGKIDSFGFDSSEYLDTLL